MVWIMSKKIWIRLRPVNQYYFGGEVSFYSDSEKNYLVESRLFPQQTAVLGLLRYVLLREKDMLTNQQHLFNGKPEKDVEDLIGKKSFDMSELEKEQDFGIIKEISPLFLQREGYAWLPLAKDAGFDFKKENQGNCDLLGKKEERIPFLVGYKAKEGYTQQFSNGKDTPLSTESIFIKTTQIDLFKN